MNFNLTIERVCIYILILHLGVAIASCAPSLFPRPTHRVAPPDQREPVAPPTVSIGPTRTLAVTIYKEG
jgi:hypothetical protein